MKIIAANIAVSIAADFLINEWFWAIKNVE